jgi:hypothetical protein
MGMIKRTLLSALSLTTCLANAASLSQDRKPTVAFKSGNGSLPLASQGSPVHLVLDAGDWPGVLRAAHDVAVDFGRVTGTNGTLTTVGSGASNQTVGGSASVIFNVTGIDKDWSVGKSSAQGKGVIIAGTVGNSSLIDELIKSGKLDVSKIEGEWEAYVSAVVKNPMNGTAEALVIAGKLSHLFNEDAISNKEKEATSVVQFTASTMSPNKLVSHLGIGSPTSHPSPTRASMPSALPKFRRRPQ